MNFPKDMQNDLKINSKKPYTIILNSRSRNSGGSTQFATYSLDWNILPDQPYLVYFSFVASDCATYIAGTAFAGQILTDFGGINNTFAPISNRQQMQNSLILGSLRKSVSSGNNFYLYANKNDNPPIYLNGRPNNLRFPVTILADNGLAFDISMLDAYILTLYFEPA